MNTVSGLPKRLLQAEGLAILMFATFIYAQLDFSWLIFAITFLAPDLSFAAYLMGPRIGAIGYNLSHTYFLSLVTILSGMLITSEPLLMAGLIWTAHIGFDRLLGYGLKYQQGFGFTHLGRIGKASRQNEL